MIRSPLFAFLVILLFLNPILQHKSIDDYGNFDDDDASADDLDTSNGVSYQLASRRTTSTKRKIWKEIQDDIRDLKDHLLLPIATNVTYIQHVLTNIVSKVHSISKEVEHVKVQSHITGLNVTDARKDHKRLMNKVSRILNNVTLTLYEIGRISRHVTEVQRGHGMINERLEIAIDKVNEIPMITHLLNDVKSDSRRLRIALDNGTTIVTDEIDVVQNMITAVSNSLSSVHDSVTAVKSDSRRLRISLANATSVLTDEMDVIQSMINAVSRAVNSVREIVSVVKSDSRQFQIALDNGTAFLSEEIDIVQNLVTTVSSTINSVNEIVTDILEKVNQHISIGHELLMSNVSQIENKLITQAITLGLLDTKLFQLAEQLYEQSEKIMAVWKTVSQLSENMNELVDNYRSVSKYLEVLRENIMSLTSKIDVMHNRMNNLDNELQQISLNLFYTRRDISTLKSYVYDIWKVIRTKCGHDDKWLNENGTMSPAQPVQPEIIPDIWYPNNTQPPSVTENALPIPTPTYPPLPDYPPVPIPPDYLPPSSPSLHPIPPVDLSPSSPSLHPISPDYLPPSSPSLHPISPDYLPPSSPSLHPIPPDYLPPSSPSLHPIPPGYPSASNDYWNPILPPKPEYPSLPVYPPSSPNFEHHQQPHFNQSEPKPSWYSSTERPLPLGLPLGRDRPGLSIGSGAQFVGHCVCVCPCDCDCPKSDPRIPVYIITKYDNVRYVMPGYREEDPKNRCHCLCMCPCPESAPGANGAGSKPVSPLPHNHWLPLSPDLPSDSESPSHYIPQPNQIPGIPPSQVPLAPEFLGQTDKSWYLHLLNEMVKGNELMRKVAERIEAVSKAEHALTKQFVSDKINKAVGFLLQEVHNHFGKSIGISTDILRTVHTLRKELQISKENDQHNLQVLTAHMTQIQKDIIALTSQFITGIDGGLPKLPSSTWLPYHRPGIQQSNFVLLGEHPLVPGGSLPYGPPIPESPVLGFLPLGVLTPLGGQFNGGVMSERNDDNVNNSSTTTPATLTDEKMNGTVNVARRSLLDSDEKENTADVRKSNGDPRNNKSTERWAVQKNNSDTKRHSSRLIRKRKLLLPCSAYRTMDKNYDNYVQGDFSCNGEKNEMGDLLRTEIALLDNNMNTVDTSINPFAMHNFVETQIRNKLMSAIRPHLASGVRGKHRPLGRSHGQRKSHYGFTPGRITILPKFLFIQSPVRLKTIVPSEQSPYSITIRSSSVPTIAGILPPRLMQPGISGSPYSVSYNDGKGNAWNVNVNRRNSLAITGNSNAEHETNENKQDKGAEQNLKSSD